MVARKEHLKPSEVEEWCLPDIVFMYSSYIEESQELAELEDKASQDIEV